ncbi:Lsr2 family protein [Nocardia sp. NPDC101769]|uniref:histone-like nucleoid-structuring protein Lsr2 n=1 Tax=Nocardia sp. NPDC101769 TaxID=3364333 RepID=UPI003819FC94
MARKVVVSIVDDFDGESVADETVNFTLDGVEYEIDLSHSNAEQLRSVFEPWILCARKVRGSRRKPAVVNQRSTTDRQESTQAREWARANGLQVSARGRIPVEVLESYRAATN